MDIATPVGVGAGLAVIFTAQVLEGGNPVELFQLPAMLLVFGTTFLVSMAGNTMADMKGVIGGAKTAMTGGNLKPAAEIVPVIVSLADKARREGLLALEESMKDVDDEFLAKGVTFAIDGTDPDEVREILEAEVSAKKKNDKAIAKYFADCGAYAPTIGIIGTVMGLVHVLGNLSEPDKLGHMIAAAFIATLWGVMSANVLFLPMGNRLKRLSELECGRMELIIEGVSAIQAGGNPRVIQSKLISLIPTGQQPATEAA